MARSSSWRPAAGLKNGCRNGHKREMFQDLKLLDWWWDRQKCGENYQGCDRCRALAAAAAEQEGQALMAGGRERET